MILRLTDTFKSYDSARWRDWQLRYVILLSTKYQMSTHFTSLTPHSSCLLTSVSAASEQHLKNMSFRSKLGDYEKDNMRNSKKWWKKPEWEYIQPRHSNKAGLYRFLPIWINTQCSFFLAKLWCRTSCLSTFYLTPWELYIIINEMSKFTCNCLLQVLFIHSGSRTPLEKILSSIN